jgi:hypothetical protein
VKIIRFFFPLIVMIFIVTACGYHNPNIYNGPSKTIYLAQWKNRTSQLGFDARIYQSLTAWFQKIDSITTVRKKEQADLILSGEIISLDLPSLSYNSNNEASQVNVNLKVRYVLKEISSNKIVYEIPSELWTQPYVVSSDITFNRSNEQKALGIILEDLSKRIYRLTLIELPKL